MKRCSRGTRRNKKTGLCESTSTATVSKKKRCPNGSRRNKSGDCIPNENNKTKRTLFDYYSAQKVGKGKKAAYMKVQK